MFVYISRILAGTEKQRVWVTEPLTDIDGGRITIEQGYENLFEEDDQYYCKKYGRTRLSLGYWGPVDTTPLEGALEVAQLNGLTFSMSEPPRTSWYPPAWALKMHPSAIAKAKASGKKRPKKKAKAAGGTKQQQHKDNEEEDGPTAGPNELILELKKHALVMHFQYRTVNLKEGVMKETIEAVDLNVNLYVPQVNGVCQQTPTPLVRSCWSTPAHV